MLVTSKIVIFLIMNPRDGMNWLFWLPPDLSVPIIEIPLMSSCALISKGQLMIIGTSLSICDLE
jgi:hypothetical protein